MLDTTHLEACHPGYLDEVKKFAAAHGLADQLQEQLDYLDGYGNGDNRCVLGKDHAPHSFAFAMYRPNDAGEPGAAPLQEKWKYWFQGGLILQGLGNKADGSFPVCTVSLAEGTGWFVHT